MLALGLSNMGLLGCVCRADRAAEEPGGCDATRCEMRRGVEDQRTKNGKMRYKSDNRMSFTVRDYVKLGVPGQGALGAKLEVQLSDVPGSPLRARDV
jgi:hypothetical protein